MKSTSKLRSVGGGGNSGRADSIRGWKKLSVWAALALVFGFVTSLIRTPSADDKLVDLFVTGTILLNAIPLYFIILGAARAMLKPTESFLENIKFVFRKDLLTTAVGITLFVATFVSIPPIASAGLWHIPIGSVSALVLVFSWAAISFAIKKVYRIQYIEEVLTPKERDKYESELNSKPQKPAKTGMFLTDLSAAVSYTLSSILRTRAKRDHILALSPIQALFILLLPAGTLSWLAYIMNIQTYTFFSAILAPAVMVLATALWAIWHNRGGLKRFFGNRVGRVMKPTKNS